MNRLPSGCDPSSGAALLIDSSTASAMSKPNISRTCDPTATHTAIVQTDTPRLLNVSDACAASSAFW